MKQSTQFNLDKSYQQYIKRLSAYGLNPMSKKEFEDIVIATKVRSPRKNRKRRVNTNIKLAKAALKEQFDKMTGYQKYLVMWKRAKKLGFIKAKNPMPRDEFIRKKNLIGNVREGTKRLVQEAYITDKKQVPALIEEAKLQGFKITAFDIYKQNKKYKDFLKIINKKGGWIKFDAAYYNDLKLAGATEEELVTKNDLFYDEEEDLYGLPF